MLTQLPASCQQMIYKDFLFKEFLYTFRRFFQFKVEQDLYKDSGSQRKSMMFGFNFIKYELKEQEDGTYSLNKNIKINYPYYTFKDDNFSLFMINLLNSLEYRQFQNSQILVHELQECTELLFVEQGRYNIGYEINKKTYFRKQRGPISIIGGYQICHNKRFEFIYKTCNALKGHAIRKINFQRLMNSNQIFKSIINIKFWRDYGHNVYLPVTKRKNMDILD